MSEKYHGIKNRSDDDEEEDIVIEFLRLAALKTLQNKKDNVSEENSPVLSTNFNSSNFSSINNQSLQLQPLSHHSLSSSNRNQSQSFTQSYNNHNNNYATGCFDQQSYNSMGVTRKIPNSLETYEKRQRSQNLDINEPYVPQCIQTSNVGYSKPRVPWLPSTPSISNENLSVNVFNNLGSYTSSLNKPVVQLSPRSQAFVAQNNDILARRKGDRSPIYSKNSLYSRNSSSPKYGSPSYQINQSSPSYRWSKSPTNKHNYRRSISRSPPSQGNSASRPQSPTFSRRRTISRSPSSSMQKYRQNSGNYYRYSSRSPPTHQILQSNRLKSRSPNISHVKSLKNRSPISIRQSSRSPPIHGRQSRKTSRSPTGISSCQRNNSRHNSPFSKASLRYNVNKQRSPISHPNRKNLSPIDVRENHHRSPTQNSINNNQHNKNINKRKSLSPLNKQQRNRSGTPNSPIRKYSRKGKVPPINDGFNNERSPIQKKHKNYMSGRRLSRNRGRNHSRKSKSPSESSILNNRKQNSKSRNSEKLRNSDENQYRKRNRINGNQYKKHDRNTAKFSKDDDLQFKSITKYNNPNNNNKIVKNEIEITKNDENCKNIVLEISENVKSLTPPMPINVSGKSDQNNKNEELLNYADDQKNDTIDKNISSDDDNDDGDGIDLFPSDESGESENEGRFKSSTNRTERKTNIPILSFAKLNETSVPEVIKDLQDVCNIKNNRNGRNFDRRRDERFKKNDNSRNSRNDRRRNNNNNNNDMRRRNSRSRSNEKLIRGSDVNGKMRRGDSGDNSMNSLPNDKRRNDDKPMFKATFQAVENEVSRLSSKVISKTEKNSNSKDNFKKRFKDHDDTLEKNRHKTKTNSTSPYLRSNNFKEDNKSVEKKNRTSKKIALRRNSVGNGNGNENASNVMTKGNTNGKKSSILLRLGAMTNTFKSAKT